MSQENVEVVRKLWDAYSRGDFDGVIALTDPYVVLISLEEGPLYGPDAVRANYARWMEAWEEEPEPTVEEVIGNGDHVLVIACFRARVGAAASESQSGCTRSTRCATAASCALTSSSDRAAALEAVGLRSCSTISSGLRGRWPTPQAFARSSVSGLGRRGGQAFLGPAGAVGQRVPSASSRLPRRSE